MTVAVSEEDLADSHGTQASADTILDFLEEAWVSVKVHHTCYAPLTTAGKSVQIDLETDIIQFVCVCLVSGRCQRTIVWFSHLGEVRVKIAVGKHFLNFSRQVLMRVLISSSVFAPSKIQEFVANVECLADHPQQHANGLKCSDAGGVR